ncbi:MAG: hypothetical protein E7012_03835 [Alphaproteobacteria bacterium]|nr:hypothetical protein [Alphaproteobacteria bacterium]
MVFLIILESAIILAVCCLVSQIKSDNVDYSSCSNKTLMKEYCKLPLLGNNFYYLWRELDRRNLVYKAMNKREKI